MHISVLEVSEAEGVTARADVALLVKVAAEMLPVNYLSKAKHSDIKFSHGCIMPMLASNQQWIVYIPLHDPLLIWFDLEKLLDLRK